MPADFFPLVLQLQKQEDEMILNMNGGHKEAIMCYLSLTHWQCEENFDSFT